MATVASVIPSLPTVQTATTSSTRQVPNTDSSTPFQTALTQATTAARSTQAAKAASDAEAANDAETKAAADQADKEDAANAAANLAAANLAAQLAATNATGIPVPLTGTAAIDAGQVTTDAQNTGTALVASNQTVPPTLSSPLFRQFVAEAGAQNNTRLPALATPPTPPAPNPTTVPTTTTLPQNIVPQVATTPTLVPPVTTGLPGAVDSVQPGQRLVVTAQAPIAAGLLQNQPETGATMLPTPVAAPQAPIETTAVPETRLGNRPGTAGDQFAAIASAASTLPVAQPPAPATTTFALPVTAPTSAPPPAPATPTPTPVISQATLAAPSNTIPVIPEQAPTTVPAPIAAPVLPSNAQTQPPVTPTAPAPVTNAPAPTQLTPNALTPPAPITNTVSAPNTTNAQPSTTPAPTPNTAPSPTAPQNTALAPNTTPTPNPVPAPTPKVAQPAPSAAPAPTQFATGGADSGTANTTTVAAPRVPTQLADFLKPTVRESQFGDATQSSGSAGPLPTSLAPNSTTTPQAPTTVQAPTPAAQVADGIVTHAHTVERAGTTTEFHMRLDPPDLGPVRIRLVNNGDGINGQVVVSNDAIRRMIESQLPELRQRLEAAGVTVQGFDVSTDANTSGGANTGSNASAPSPLADFARQVTRATGPPPRPPTVRGAGVLDVMV